MGVLDGLVGCVGMCVGVVGVGGCAPTCVCGGYPACVCGPLCVGWVGGCNRMCMWTPMCWVGALACVDVCGCELHSTFVCVTECMHTEGGMVREFPCTVFAYNNICLNPPKLDGP